MKKVCFLMAVICLMVVLASCAPGSGKGAVELTDGAGRTVSVNVPAKRIVAMLPADVEILYALGAQDAIVAVGEYCNYPADALNKDSVGTGTNTSVEQLIALKPDLVIMGKMAQEVQQTEALGAAGIPVVISDPQTIADTYIIIEMLGMLVDKPTEAKALITQMKADFDSIPKDIEQKKRAYVEISPLEYGLFTCGNRTFINELLVCAGVENAFGDLDGWPEISEEQVIARNPDVIFTTADGVFGPPDPVAEISERAGWDTITAVRDGEVRRIDADMCTRPGPRLAQAAREIYEAAYGE